LDFEDGLLPVVEIQEKFLAVSYLVHVESHHTVIIALRLFRRSKDHREVQKNTHNARSDDGVASTPRIISAAPTMLGTLTSTQQKGPIRLTALQSFEAALAQHYYLPHPPFQFQTHLDVVVSQAVILLNATNQAT
jgi:hypothetical protein